MTKTCKNCRHGKAYHSSGIGNCTHDVDDGTGDGQVLTCPCKKFEGEDETYNEVIHNFLEQELNKEYEKPQKGCGKVIYGDGKRWPLECNGKNLCLECENHSHQHKEASDDKGSDVSGKNTTSASGSFNLSEKITTLNTMHKWINAKDIKEFIRRLKFEFRELYHVNKEIDKLAGKELK